MCLLINWFKVPELRQFNIGLDANRLNLLLHLCLGMASLSGCAVLEETIAALDRLVLEEGWQPCTSILLLWFSSFFFDPRAMCSRFLDVVTQCKRCPHVICGAAILIVSACLE